MKTWVFDEGKLELALTRWVEKQIATGHPKAVSNAEFVAECMRDMLHGDATLFKETDLSEPASSTKPSLAGAPAGQQGDVASLSIEEMKRAWESGE